jgi:hypothetical protein
MIVEILFINRQNRKNRFCTQFGTSDILLQLASCTGGGALLGLALLDVLPELRERIDLEGEYPLAEVLMIRDGHWTYKNIRFDNNFSRYKKCFLICFKLCFFWKFSN